MDWNAKIIWKMRTELEFQWDLVEEEIPTVFGNLLSEIKELLEDLKELIRGNTLPLTQVIFQSRRISC